MTFHMPDSWYEPPNVPDATDDPGTACLGSYPETATDDAYTCEDRTTCHLCGNVVCTEHDDTDDCDGPVHESCHDQGCYSASCAADRRDDYLLAQAGM